MMAVWGYKRGLGVGRLGFGLEMGLLGSGIWGHGGGAHIPCRDSYNGSILGSPIGFPWRFRFPIGVGVPIEVPF